MHAHLQGRDAYAGHGGHFLIAQPFHVLQHERLPLLRRQLRQGPRRERELLRALEGRLVVGRVRHWRCLLQRHVTDVPAREITLAPVRHDAVQPGAQPRGVPAARQMAVRPHQALSHGVRRGIAAPQHPRREPHEAGFVAADHQAERLAIAAEHTGHHLLVGGASPHIHMTCIEIRASR